MNLNDKLPRFERVVKLALSDDAESKKALETKLYNVTFILEEGWTINELVDKLLGVTTSPRVAFQNANRGKEVVPTKYIVPKAGARTVAVPLTEDEMLDLIAKKYGDKAIEMLKDKII